MNTTTQCITRLIKETAQALLLLLLALPPVAQAAFMVNADGTVTDTVTGLMWDQCSQGQSGATCTGEASVMSWSAALTAAVTANAIPYKGYSDWRLPNKNELESLVDLSIVTNPVIDLTFFPGTPADSLYWSATTYKPNLTFAWRVYFGDGFTNADFATSVKSSNFAVRLVRSVP